MPLAVFSDADRARIRAQAIAHAGQRCIVEFDLSKEPYPYRVNALDLDDRVRAGDHRPAGVRVVSVHPVPSQFAARRRAAA